MTHSVYYELAPYPAPPLPPCIQCYFLPAEPRSVVDTFICGLHSPPWSSGNEPFSGALAPLAGAMATILTLSVSGVRVPLHALSMLLCCSATAACTFTRRGARVKGTSNVPGIAISYLRCLFLSLLSLSSTLHYCQVQVPRRVSLGNCLHSLGEGCPCLH